jgi:hypothetical protein
MESSLILMEVFLSTGYDKARVRTKIYLMLMESSLILMEVSLRHGV